jgi:putative oxidoreductase
VNVFDAASRAALGWVFIHAGSDVLRKPEAPAKKAAPVLAGIRQAVPLELPDDTLLVRLNAGTQVVAGAALMFGKAPRLAALALIGSLVPTTAGGHRFWEFEAAERMNQRNHFIKNLSIVGGLLQVVITPRRRSGKESA